MMFNKKTICVTVIISVLIICVVGIISNLPEIRYDFAQKFLPDHIVYNGNHYYFYGSESDVDSGMTLLGDEIRITLVDKKGSPYMSDKTELAYLYNNDPDVKYIYYGGGSWKKGSPPA